MLRRLSLLDTLMAKSQVPISVPDDLDITQHAIGQVLPRLLRAPLDDLKGLTTTLFNLQTYKYDEPTPTS